MPFKGFYFKCLKKLISEKGKMTTTSNVLRFKKGDIIELDISLGPCWLYLHKHRLASGVLHHLGLITRELKVSNKNILMIQAYMVTVLITMEDTLIVHLEYIFGLRLFKRPISSTIPEGK